MQASPKPTDPFIADISAERTLVELEQVSSRYHITGAWIAIVFDPLFALTDYFNIPNGWLQVFFIRLGIAGITLITLLLRKRYKLPSFVVVLVPFLLISLQNAYTYSLVSNQVLLGHNLNYMALLVAGGMFILWKLPYSLGVVAMSAAATVWFVTQNKTLDASRFFIEGGLLLAAVGVFMVILIKSRYDLTLKEIKARLALQASNAEIGRQKELLEERNERITDSIRYAHSVQKSILENQPELTTWFSDTFVVFKPLDILSSDFYWFYENEEVKIIVAADCTGQGVPSAMMTVICNAALNDLVIQRRTYTPDALLNALDKRIAESFRNEISPELQKKNELNIGILSFSSIGLSYAGANYPLFIASANTLVTYTGAAFPVCQPLTDTGRRFDKQNILLEKWDRLYFCSRGFRDFFADPAKPEAIPAAFLKFLKGISLFPLHEQRKETETIFEQFKTTKNQTDDVLIIGIEV